MESRRRTPPSSSPFRRLGLCVALAAVTVIMAPVALAGPSLEDGFRTPPPEARPHTYWLWLNGHVHLPTAVEELRAMKDAGLGGVLLFEMGARGDPATIPSPGPAFLSPEWVAQLQVAADEARRLGLQVDMSVISSWDMGGPWIDPAHAVMALYATEAVVQGGKRLDVALPFPEPEKLAPLGPDGRPAFWTDVSVLAIRDARRLASHEFVLRLDPVGVHDLAAVVLDQGRPEAPAALASTMTPVRRFSIAVSTTGESDSDFTEILQGELKPGEGRQRFELPAGTKASHVRLRLLSGHDAARARWTLGEFEVLDPSGRNVAASHTADQSRDGALLVRAPTPLSYAAWRAGNVHNGLTRGSGGVFATAGLPSFDIRDRSQLVDVTRHVDREGRLRWEAPAGAWTILRYVCMVTGEKLKVPSPASTGLASDHLSAEATRIHMNHVVEKLKKGLGPDLAARGLKNMYLASYEVVGRVWSPVFAGEFKRRRGYELETWLPAIFGARIGNDELTQRFLFDYQKTLGEVVVDAYYRTAVEVARAAGLKVKSEAGGPGPPIHTPPVDALLADGTVDSVQGEFWPFWPDNDALNVIKEPASAAHIYGKPRVHLESFTSFHHWAEGPQDLKPSADRVLTEGGNHFVWHTWTHQAPDYGLPGLVYGAGTHLSRSVTWWPKARPFLSYLARSSFLLQRGRFVADVLYYYGDGGMNFVGPRRNPSALGPGYDYDVVNADVILNRLSVRNGRLTLPDGTSYAMLVLPETDAIHPPVLEKLEALVRGGAVIAGARPMRASGLQGYPESDRRVRDVAAKVWGDLDGRTRTSRRMGDGRVYWGVTERQVLGELGLSPDFLAPASLDFTHRRDGSDDIYFVRNRTDEPVRTTASFREAGRSVEFWDAVNGTIRRISHVEERKGRTDVPLALAARGSGFVIFRAGGSPGKLEQVDFSTAPVPRKSLSLERNWTVDFSSGLAAPGRLELSRVEPWTRQSDPAWRYFSGTGRYRHIVSLPPGWTKDVSRVELELGKLWSIGEVWINGVSQGVVWTQPFSIDCTKTLREGDNEIVVEVVGTWHNRLVGEARGELPRLTRTNIAVSQRKPWKELDVIEAGLFGPVRLVGY
ncbi:MAG: hypothetical protein KBA71_08830 [Opitutaceae bacterium]|nr:hypothetical protein [Opitutaceae bacterium]